MRTDKRIVGIACIQCPAKCFLQCRTFLIGINLGTNEQYAFVAFDRVNNKVPVGCQSKFEVVGSKVMLYGISTNVLIKNFVHFNCMPIIYNPLFCRSSAQPCRHMP